MWEFEAKKSDRLDRILREERLPGAEWLSRQAWDWLFEKGNIFVSGRKVGKAGTEIGPGSRIRVDLPGPLGLLPAREEAQLLWTSTKRDLAVFHKQAGVATLPLFPWDHTTFASQVAAYAVNHQWMSASAFAALAEAPRLEGGVLQRLDRDTSGLIAVAFTSEAKCLFRQLFSDSKIEKAYLAIVEGVAPEGEHRVWLQSSGGATVRAKLEAPKGAAVEPSVLHVKNCDASGKHSLVEVRTCHGERHVVRASLAALGHPLVGDVTYGGSNAAPFHQLHARSLRLLERSAFPEFPQDLTAPPSHTFLDSLAQLGLKFTG